MLPRSLFLLIIWVAHILKSLQIFIVESRNKFVRVCTLINGCGIQLNLRSSRIWEMSP